jgi:DNA-binding CsgD family transcriptional regulator
MGKTTLLQAVLARVYGTAVILHARCHDAERDFPFGVVRQLLDTVTSSAENAPGSLTAGFAGTGGQEQDLHSLYQATRSLAASTSVVIAIDDFNYADPQSAQWFAYIARRLDGLPVSMILAGDADYRDGIRVVDELHPLPYFRQVNLRPLCGQCGETLVATVFSQPADVEFAAACHDVARGNPLILLELCRRLKGAGVSPAKTEIGRVAEAGAATLWETVGAGLRLRQPSAVELIECLAILGPDAGLETAAILAGHGELAIEGARELLGRAGLLTGYPVSRFTQPHLRAAIVARMDPERRHALHSKAASLLTRLGAPPGDVAAHVMSISPSGTPGNVQVLRVAAQEAMTEQNWPEAARFLRRALAEATEPDLLLSISADLGAVEIHRDLRSSLRYMRTVTDSLRETPEAAAALASFASLVLTLNSPSSGQAFAHACTRLIAPEVSPAEQAAPRSPAEQAALCRLATQAMLSGHRTEIGLALRATAAPAAAEDLRCALAIVTAARGSARQRAVIWARRCGDLAKADRDNAWLPVAGCALVLGWAGLEDEATELAERQVALAAARQSAAELALARLTASEIAYRRGDLAASLAASQAAMDDAVAVGADGLHMAASTLSARVLIERGETGDAASLLAGIDRNAGAHHLIKAFHLYIRGRYEMARGRLPAGLTLFTDAGQLLLAHGITNPACLGWRARAVLASAALGLAGQARKLAAEEIAAARAWGAPVAIGRALTVASAAQPAAAGLGLLHEAAAILDGTGALLEQARTQVRLGHALHASGADREARVALHRGLDLATRCDAIPLAARAQDYLLAAGARVRNGAAFRPSPLTAGERRVTELVLQGLTNHEVAIKLCISKRTVDTHLAHIYRKLGIRGRSQLREAVHGMASHGEPSPGQRALAR